MDHKCDSINICMYQKQISPVQVAAVSGDVRRCLELLRRAAEITEAKSKQAAAPAANASSQPQASGASAVKPPQMLTS